MSFLGNVSTCKLMFSTLKYRQHIAVLAALAMVASVLVAAPAVAADDPEPSYTATFDACGSAPASGFEDVPPDHAGDIDCIAYYGITKGTSATTYSPFMSVTREHMALFLTRLAGLVGIDVASTPDNPGFTDTGDLSANSQTAIAQLADRGITKGTSDTTYSPGDSVTRGQMALFIARLMNQMDPMEVDDVSFGSTPSEVEDTDDKPVGTPFTDLGPATKSAYDAITSLYELGVASGISDTAYAPSALITRAAMAEFMAGVLGHSNARPAGISIQASATSGFGAYESNVVVSYRDDNFASMVDLSIQVFDTDTVGALTDDGNCPTATVGDCEWSDDDEFTDDNGNILVVGGVTGADNTYYAWMGDADNTDFDADDDDHVSVALSYAANSLQIRVTADTNDEVGGDGTTSGAHPVNLDKDNTVVLTAQLIDVATANDADAGAVTKSGVEITVNWAQTSDAVGSSLINVYPAPDKLTTDENGQVTFTITGPPSEDADTNDPDRLDTVMFSGDVVGNADSPATVSASLSIDWTDDLAAAAKGVGSAPEYVVEDDGEASVRASVTFYDQYGNTAGKGETVDINIDDAGDVERTINSRGSASLRVNAEAEASETVTVVISDGPADVGVVDPVNVVEHANKTDTTAAVAPGDVYDDENRFRIGGNLYSYDSGDVFISGGKNIDMAEFEKQLTADNSAVQVVAYSSDSDGTSIFVVSNTS